MRLRIDCRSLGLPHRPLFGFSDATAWHRFGLVILLGMVLLLSSAATMADVPSSADAPSSTVSGQVGIEPHADAHSNIEFINADYPQPRCHHGHGTRNVGSALLRLERQDLDFEPLPLSMTAPAIAPRVVTASGRPSALLSPSSVPVYLLTQRYRV